MKKIIKYKSDLFKQEITLTIDPKLDRLKGKVPFPQKQEKANEMLRNLKTPLPK